MPTVAANQGLYTEGRFPRFPVGSRVRLSKLAIEKEVYKGRLYRIGTVLGMGNGPNTRFCVRVRWSKGTTEHLVHRDFLVPVPDGGVKLKRDRIRKPKEI